MLINIKWLKLLIDIIFYSWLVSWIDWDQSSMLNSNPHDMWHSELYGTFLRWIRAGFYKGKLKVAKEVGLLERITDTLVFWIKEQFIMAFYSVACFVRIWIANYVAFLLWLQSLLCDPNPNSPANSEAARMFSENKREYNRRVREIVEQSWTAD